MQCRPGPVPQHSHVQCTMLGTCHVHGAPKTFQHAIEHGQLRLLYAYSQNS